MDMPIQFPEINRISFDEANPALTGFAKGQALMQSGLQFPQDLQAKMLQNAIAKVTAKYAEPNAVASLTTAQQHNMFDPRIWNSEIALRGAQGGLATSEAAKNRFLVGNPEYISPEGMLIQKAIEHQQAQAQGNGQQGGSSGSAANGSNGQPSQAGDQQFNRSQYHPDAMAFNPPQLPSPTGDPNLDNMYFKKYGMSPIVQTQLDLAKSQSEKYQGENIDRNKQFNNESIAANQSTLDAQKFLEASDKLHDFERGFVGSQIPAVSDASQNMEAASAAMAQSGATLFQPSGHITDADISLQKMIKSGRHQNEEVATDIAHGIIAKNDRMRERQQFYARGTQMGLKPEVMDAMWNKFNGDRPYMDTTTKTPNDSYNGTSKDYLTPEAVNAFLNGNKYTTPNSKQLKDANFNDKDLKSLKTWAKSHQMNPKDFEKKNLYKLAKKEGISMSGLKAELKKMGAF
jgi:hypothetical protein